MLRNYFITALRNIIRNRIQTFIQVLSLAIGITAAVLIGLYVRHELSYDKFNERFDRIYRLEFGDQVGMWTAVGHQIKQHIPEVENVVRMVNWWGKDKSWPVIIPANDSADERIVNVEDMFFCDSSIFEVFTFNFIQGDPKTVFRNPHSVVLSINAARKIFGNRDPVGEALKLENRYSEIFTVTGIFEDVKNSHLEINGLVPLVSYDSVQGYRRGEPEYLNNWVPSLSFVTYLLLNESNNASYIEGRINDYFLETWKRDFNYSSELRFSLRPLRDIYFSTGFTHEFNSCRHGNLKLLRALLTITVIILILGIINYVNLTTARASLRAKEIGIRKVSGSSKGKLIKQFLVESILVTLFSFLIAITLVQVMLPGFNQLAATELDMEIMNEPVTWMIFLIAVIFLGLVSGIYPAVYLTGFQPITPLPGEQVKGSGSAIFRRVLLTFQFTVSVVLMIGVFVIQRQINYMKSADLGFNRELVINISSNFGWAYDLSRRQLYKQELMQNPNVKGVAFSSRVMGENLFTSVDAWEIEGIKKHVGGLAIDPDFFDVMEIELVDGRNFSWNRIDDYFDTGDQYRKIIVNETFVREFELESPVGYINKNEYGFTHEIIGVVRDFHFYSQHEKIAPCIYPWGGYSGEINIKIVSKDITATLRFIKKVFESLNPDPVFQYQFLDETYNRQYLKDEKTAKIITNFAIVAVLIACLGLFGLSSFMAVRRTREIGIRKAMGASERSIFLLLSREFIKWVVLSIVIACPVAWYIMNKWLQSFAYRTSISWWIFVLAILIAFAITFITVTWQSLKTARTNPVEALRYE